MARLRRRSPVGQDTPADAEFLPSACAGTAKHTTRARSSPRKQPAKAYGDAGDWSSDEPECHRALVPKVTPQTARRVNQIRLMPLYATSETRAFPESNLMEERPSRPKSPTKGSPMRSNALRKDALISQEHEPAANAYVSDSAPEGEIEASLWRGSEASSSDSDDDLPSPRKLIGLLPFEKRRLPALQPMQLFKPIQSLPQAREADLVFDAPAKKLESLIIASSRPSSSSDKENQAAFLRFSPPRIRSPSKNAASERPVTPPQSPSKPRLQSPSKSKARVPTQTIRQSLDAFWNVDTVNDWTDQFSPQKVLKSPRKLKFLKDEQSQSPTSSPRKFQSPSKANQAEREAKRTFETSKRCIAEQFLSELDQKVCNGEVQRLAQFTGGVKFVWSKTLNSTAGRANWRKETTKTTKADGSTATTYKHYASIELAEKVINDEERLLNVIAHEFCHLANFMISGIKDQPHGRQFKEWGRKCSAAFAHRGVEVTTKHTYEIDYKYIWQCSSEDCAVEFKRHSKSIDPKRHTCGSCRSNLVQIKPTPRKDAGNTTGYAAYVKLHFAEIKRDMPGASQKMVMEAVGKKYRAEKAAAAAEIGSSIATDLDAVARKLEVVTLDAD